MSVKHEERRVGDTAVVIGEELNIAKELRSFFEEGALTVVYDMGVAALADEVIGCLKSCYKTFRYPVRSRRSLAAGIRGEKGEAPDYVRHVLAVGAGSAAECAKELAGQLDVDWSLLLTAPSTDRIMCGKLPKAVFIANNVLINCPNECIAAGYGILFSQQLSSFESLFNRKVLAQSGSENDVKNVTNLKLTELAYELIKISSNKRVDDSADLVSRVLYENALKRGRRPRLMGEYKFLASSMLTVFYSAFLGSPSIDTMPPASLEVAADIMHGLGIESECKKVDFFDVNSYFKISYILSEYRMDLLDRLSGVDNRTSGRYWRRLYPDAGYWLKSEISCRDMLAALPVAGAMSDSLLGYAYASGVLSRM